jgi:multidrug efflux pump subunit AcrA (membrane-fusion protein)
MPWPKAKQAEVADRRAQLVKLRLAGVRFDDDRILALGYASRQAASKDMIRALEEHREEEAAAVSAYRQQENERLDAELERLEVLEAAARVVLQNRHIMVNNGRVILHPDTNEPMEDDAPILQAIDRLVKIEDARRRNGERRAKLNGLDMPVKAEVTGADGGPLALSTADPDKLSALIAATSRLDSADAQNTATSTPDEDPS